MYKLLWNKIDVLLYHLDYWEQKTYMQSTCKVIATWWFLYKYWVVVWTRPKLTLGPGHVTQPFYSACDAIDTLTN